MITGLIVAGGGFQGLPMLHALRAMSARVIVADSLTHNPNRFAADAYAVVPAIADKDEFSQAVLDLCEKHAIDIVFPSTPMDVPAIAELAPKLRERGIVVAVSSPELLAQWADKEICLGEFREAGIPVLPFMDAGSDAVEFPLIGKPRFGSGSRDLVAASSRSEFDRAIAADVRGQLFWQPKLESFDEWSVDFAISERGDVSPLVTRKRLRTSVGFAVVSSVEQSSAVLSRASAAAQLIASRQGCGIFNLQFLVVPSGEVWLSDVNLRSGTSSTAALGDGVNFAAFMLGEQDTERSRREFMHVRTLTDSFLPLALGNGIDALAFDLDDCLVDQKTWMDDKLSLLLAHWDEFTDAQQRARFEREARRLIDEGPWDRLLDVAVERSRLSKDLTAALIDRWRAATPARIVVYPDAAAIVKAIRSAGIAFALVTDNPAASQRQKLAKLPADMSADVVILTAELEAPKPAADGYLAAATRLGIDPSRMLAVGDSPWRDAVAALDAGYPAAVIVPRRGGMGNPEPQRFARAHPDHADRTYWMDDLYALAAILPTWLTAQS